MLSQWFSHSSYLHQCDTLIVEINDLLSPRYTKITTSIPPEMLSRILRSSTWFDYERGNLTEAECYSNLATAYALPESDIAAAVRSSLTLARVVPEAVRILRDIKATTGVRILSMSNFSAPDWNALSTQDDFAKLLGLFDCSFTSAAAGDRKPNLGFYRHVLHSSGIDPQKTVFVDGRLEHVVAGKSFGMKGIVFTNPEELSRALRPLLRDTIADAERWLHRHPKQLWSVTDTGVIIEENFSQLLLLEITQDENLADIVRLPRLTNFFRGHGVLTTAAFPHDLDTTSIACTVLDHFGPQVKDDIMNEILSLRNEDGLVQTYFDKTRPRVDPVVCVNVLTFFYANGRGSELTETLDWVYDVLANRAYEGGTLYYHSGDAFLYFLSRLLHASPSLTNRFSALYAQRIVERYGAPGDPLALAMRVLAAACMGMRDLQDYERLLMLQQEDGSWPLGWFYRNGSTGILTGNQGVTTAMAVAAVCRYRGL
ncbi:HAD-like protein [Dichomitus squalens]|uniref:HAD-like protein n=1 Tax=Dichomitus squalens TaxID=114155 RepID=A0A4Q9MQ44_9APHY|nr:HAD-like protein [Dichomitus squalens]